MLVRSAMHQVGANTLTELMRFPAPDQRNIPCPCGQQARYRELRSKPVLTAVGTVEVSRPYYLCPDCHEGQFPADEEESVGQHLEVCTRCEELAAELSDDGEARQLASAPRLERCL